MPAPRPAPPTRCPPAAHWVLLLAALAAGGGCTETRETLRLDGAGGGTYELVVRTNLDLWRQVGGIVGRKALERIEGRPFPLRAEAWRDAVTGVDGVTAETIERTDEARGWQRLTVRLRFRSLSALLAVEPLARRSLHVATRAVGDPAGGHRTATLEMTPLASVPVLDPLAALVSALEAPAPAGAGPRPARDAGPLGRMGLARSGLALLRSLLARPLADVRFRFRVEVPGVVTRAGGRPVAGAPDAAEQVFDFAALRDPRTDRRVRLAWRVRRLDTPPRADHAGDRGGVVRAGFGR